MNLIWWDWVACGFVCIGIMLIGERERMGFAVVAAGASLTAMLTLDKGLWGIAVQNMIVIALNLMAYWNWRDAAERGTRSAERGTKNEER